MDKLLWLIEYLKKELSIGHMNYDKDEEFQVFRALVNVREANSISEEFVERQDSLLQEIIENRGINNIDNLEAVGENLYIFKGDITTLKVDAIVNAANSGMVGCFHPCHKCIDNAIHTFAGVQLRLECDEIMKKQGHLEETGSAKITKAYNLPSEFVIHTVGPIIRGKLSEKDCEMLASCYKSCLDMASKKGLKSIAFCCISTGEFHFPNYEAAVIAINTVKRYLKENNSEMKVIFNVFKEQDYKIYKELLK